VILALETSSATASAAVVAKSGRALGESRPLTGALQARRLLDCVHEALTTAGVALDEVETVVCGLGPGAFTGLRIGVATARALAQASGLPVAGVPSLEALARGLAAGAAGASGDFIVPLIDGRRSEVFAAVYRRVSAQPGLELVAPLVVVAVAAPSALMVARAFLAGSPALTLGFAATLPIYGREPDALPRSSSAVGAAAAPSAGEPRR
jgi:tRNA threonylcarbamoyladenosine biosynthesis protein TsaB